MRKLALGFLASALLPLAACNFYFSDQPDDPTDPPCADWGGGPALEMPSANLWRNPSTGECQSLGGDLPPDPCDYGQCGNCTDIQPGTATGASAFEEAPGAPTWGLCESYCTELDELSCLAADSCRGIYTQLEAGLQFSECWSVGGVPSRSAECSGLDAESCSQSNLCIAIHDAECDTGEAPPDGFVEPECRPTSFLSCDVEPTKNDGCYGNNDCAPGSHCTANEVCLPPPGNGACPDGECDVPSVCYGYCELDVTPAVCSELASEDACIARTDCSPLYYGDDCECGPEGCVCSQWTYDSCDNYAP